MSGYSHRERVKAAIAHEEPDRVPLDMMGNATMLLDGTYLRLRDHLRLSPIPPFRSGTSANYYDERILEHLDIDFRRVCLKEAAKASNGDVSQVSSVDAWGVRYVKDRIYVNAVECPLKGCTTQREIESHPWPRASDMFSDAGLAEHSERMHLDTDYAVVARNPLSAGFLDRCCQLVGMEGFLVLLATEPAVARCLIAKLLTIYMEVYGMLLDAVGRSVDVVEVADDIGTQHSLLISESMYREFLKPAETVLYDFIRQRAPGAAIFRHCDGAIFPIIPDLIEMGVSVLNPVQTSCQGMRASRLKDAFGSSLTFHGAIEGTGGAADDLVREMRERISELAPGGGYILASCNHMVDVCPTNITTMFEAAHDVGSYRRSPAS